jgi:FkbM family methyltransferase
MINRLCQKAPPFVKTLALLVRSYVIDGYAMRTYSQEGEDMILRRLFAGRKTGFYVDVGAHHPMRYSNTYYFYKLGWRGINIEPNPAAVGLFRRLRKRDINVQLGVSDNVGELTYFVFNEPALNSFDEALSLERQSDQYRIIDKITVRVKPLEAVLDESLPKDVKMDFLSIDVEGYDLNVLRSNNWVKYRPTCVLVEALGTDTECLPSTPIHQFLHSKGYRFFAKTFNTMIYLNVSNQ